MGPAAPAIAEAAVSVYGAISGANAQRKERDAANAAAQNQAAALNQATSLAQQEAQGPSFQSLLDAQKGGVQTLKSQIGGVPNVGALIKTLFGGNIENAIGASLAQRNANLQGASNTLIGVGQQYGQDAQVPNQPNPYVGAATGLFGALNQLGKKPGAAPSGDIGGPIPQPKPTYSGPYGPFQ